MCPAPGIDVKVVPPPTVVEYRQLLSAVIVEVVATLPDEPAPEVGDKGLIDVGLLLRDISLTLVEETVTDAVVLEVQAAFYKATKVKVPVAVNVCDVEIVHRH